MMSKLKNVIIFIVIGVVLTGGYFMFVKKPAGPAELVSSSGSTTTSDEGSLNEEDSIIAKELLGVLLNVKNIRLDVGIFDEEAFASLRDSTILLIPDGTEGRPNPFAPIGRDISAGAANSIPETAIITPAPTTATGTSTTTGASTTTTTTTPPTTPSTTTPSGTPAN